MQFTPQQLAGAGRYNQRTRIGNWNEDVALEESKLKDYMAKKGRGALSVHNAAARLAKSMQPVPHSFAEDGVVRFGQTIMLESRGTGWYLSNNLWESKSVPSGEVFSVTCSQTNTPVARNTFVIMRGNRADGYADDDTVLHIGQPFMLACNPSLRVDEKTGMCRPPLFLQSQIVNTMRYAKISNHQEVSLSSSSRYDSIFCVRKQATGMYQRKGDPVQANEDVLIVHQATNQALASDSAFVQTNEYGSEYEVSCHTYLSTGKTLTLNREQVGLTTGDIAQKRELSQNSWVFRLSSDATAAVDGRELRAMGPSAVLALLKEQFNNHEGGCIGFSSLCEMLDDRKTGDIDRQNFKFALRDYGIDVNNEQFDLAVANFEKNGTVNYASFLEAIESA